MTSIAVAPANVILASGKQLLFYARRDNRGENPPANLQSLRGGHITGIAVDTANGLWIADFDNSLVKGPFMLNSSMASF